MINTKKADDQKYFDEAKRRYEALTRTKQQDLREDAAKSLPPVLKQHEVAIESAIFKYLMEGDFV